MVVLDDQNVRVGDEVVENVVERHRVSARNYVGKNLIGCAWSKSWWMEAACSRSDLSAILDG